MLKPRLGRVVEIQAKPRAAKYLFSLLVTAPSTVLFISGRRQSGPTLTLRRPRGSSVRERLDYGEVVWTVGAWSAVLGGTKRSQALGVKRSES